MVNLVAVTDGFFSRHGVWMLEICFVFGRDLFGLWKVLLRGLLIVGRVLPYLFVCNVGPMPMPHKGGKITPKPGLANTQYWVARHIIYTCTGISYFLYIDHQQLTIHILTDRYIEGIDYYVSKHYKTQYNLR